MPGLGSEAGARPQILHETASFVVFVIVFIALALVFIVAITSNIAIDTLIRKY